jgi:hypothetical protein
MTKIILFILQSDVVLILPLMIEKSLHDYCQCSEETPALETPIKLSFSV